MARTELTKWMRETIYNYELSQKEIAHRTGIDRSNLSKILNGKRNFTVDCMYKLIETIETLINEK